MVYKLTAFNAVFIQVGKECLQRFALFYGTARNGMAYSVALFSGTEQIKLAAFDFWFGYTDAGGDTWNIVPEPNLFIGLKIETL